MKVPRWMAIWTAGWVLVPLIGVVESASIVSPAMSPASAAERQPSRETRTSVRGRTRVERSSGTSSSRAPRSHGSISHSRAARSHSSSPHAERHSDTTRQRQRAVPSRSTDRNLIEARIGRKTETALNCGTPVNIRCLYSCACLHSRVVRYTVLQPRVDYFAYYYLGFHVKRILRTRTHVVVRPLLAQRQHVYAVAQELVSDFLPSRACVSFPRLRLDSRAVTVEYLGRGKYFIAATMRVRLPGVHGYSYEDFELIIRQRLDGWELHEIYLEM